jgi:ABC-type antimicrobial peptide transport system permease subunit
MREGAVIGIVGIVSGAIGGVVLARLVSSYVIEVEIPGAAPIIGSAFVLVVAAVLASVMPGARASRVDIIKSLRAD